MVCWDLLATCSLCVCVFFWSPKSKLFYADILRGYDNDRLAAQLEALADMKFTHVVSCQMFGSQKTSGDPQAQDILDLMKMYFLNAI